MCGINGVVYFVDVAEEKLSSMISTMLRLTAHRGPDGYEQMIFPKVALGASRLAVIGLSEVTTIYRSDDGKKFLLFNGEIVNHNSLRKQFSLDICDKRDGAVLLPLFEKLGTDFIKHLAGMFAIAVYTLDDNCLYLWRDPLGIKPLYICQTPHAIYFSSEVKAIRSVYSDSNIDFSHIDQILRYRFSPGISTVFPDILRVLPGESIIVQEGQVKRARYWILDSKMESGSETYRTHHDTRELLSDIFAEYTQSDVPGGFFFSGGIDSSLAVSLCSNNESAYKFPLSIRFHPHATVDESYARELENAIGMKVTWVDIGSEDARIALQELVGYLDEPLENPIHIGTYMMSKMAHNMGLKTVITGDGSDEFFLGYERHVCWFSRPLSNPSSEYENWLFTLQPEQVNELYTPEAILSIKDLINSKGNAIRPFKSFEDVMAFEQGERLPEYHCMRLDRMTMAWGVEARVPFLDHRLIEHIQTINPHVRFGVRGKDLLRSLAIPWLPMSIIERPKVHFPSLPSQWLKDKEAKWAREILLDPKARIQSWFKKETLGKWINDHLEETRDYGRVLWACIVIELWLNQDWIN